MSLPDRSEDERCAPASPAATPHGGEDAPQESVHKRVERELTECYGTEDLPWLDDLVAVVVGLVEKERERWSARVFQHPCRLCGRTDYPHECLRLPTILNALYYCSDGQPHEAAPKRWWQRHPMCRRCGEALTSPRFSEAKDA